MVDGRETCVIGEERDVAGALEAPDGGAPDGGTSAGQADPCRGLCFANERCVTRSGVAECEIVK
jgi:hypothetical protein